ncbi:MAG: HXXEE domain-containing protein [Bacteroides sp.]
MSALTVLYLVLPFPVAFILHDAEEVVVQHRWMLNHKERLIAKFPKMTKLVEHLSSLTTKAFAVAAIEELVVLLVATAYVLVGGAYSVQIWSALFMAFSIHLLVHIGQAIILRGYVPGLVSTILLLPYSFIAMQSIWNAMSGMELVAWGIIGVIFMVANLRFAHAVSLLLSRNKLK